MIGGGDPFYLKFWIKLAALEQNRRFSMHFRSQPLNRNTYSATSSITTNRKSTTRLLMSAIRAQDERRTLSLSPPQGAKKRPKFEQ